MKKKKHNQHDRLAGLPVYLDLASVLGQVTLLFSDKTGIQASVKKAK